MEVIEQVASFFAYMALGFAVVEFVLGLIV